MAEQSLDRVQSSRAWVMKNSVQPSYIDSDILGRIVEGSSSWGTWGYSNVFDWEGMLNALRNLAEGSGFKIEAIDTLDALYRLSREPEFLEDQHAQGFRREQLESLRLGKYGLKRLDLLLELAQQSDKSNNSEKETALEIIKQQVFLAFDSYVDIENSASSIRAIEELGKKIKTLWQSNEEFGRCFFDYIEEKTKEGHFQFPLLFKDIALHSDEFLDRFLSIVREAAIQSYDIPTHVNCEQNKESFVGQNVLYSAGSIANNLIGKESYREDSGKISSILAAMMVSSSEQDTDAVKDQMAEMIKGNQFKELIKFVKGIYVSRMDQSNEQTVSDIAFQQLCASVLKIVCKNIPGGLSEEIDASNFPTVEDIRGVPHSTDDMSLNANLLKIERNDLKRQLAGTQSELENTRAQLALAIARAGHGSR
jgi:hypothetical protein